MSFVICKTHNDNHRFVISPNPALNLPSFKNTVSQIKPRHYGNPKPNIMYFMLSYVIQQKLMKQL